MFTFSTNHGCILLGFLHIDDVGFPSSMVLWSYWLPPGHTNQWLWHPAWAFLIVFCNNYSSKMHCSWATGMGHMTALLTSILCSQLWWWETYTHTFNGICPGLPGWAGTRKVKPIWILLKQETVSGSGISWDICKSATCSRKITTPAPHHSVFYRPDALPAAQPKPSKHWRQNGGRQW